MPRGGARPGAGRKPKPVPVATVAASVPAAPPVVQMQRGQMTPLDYMMQVINDPFADDARRDRMAQAAAPYVHPRAEAEAPGKKAQREAAAKVAERGTDWEALLTAPPAGKNGLGNRLS